MSQSIGKEVHVFLKAVATGAILWAIYDVLRVFRILIPHKQWLIGLQDLVFWITCALGIFNMLYWENDGYLRGFSIGGIILGMVLYGQSISPWILKISRIIMIHTKKMLRKIGETVRMGLCKQRK